MECDKLVGAVLCLWLVASGATSVQSALNCSGLVPGAAYNSRGKYHQTAIELQVCCNSTSLVTTITPHEYVLDFAVAAFVCYDALNDVVQQEMMEFNVRHVFSHTSNLSSTAVRCSANVSYIDRNNNPEENIYAMCSIPPFVSTMAPSPAVGSGEDCSEPVSGMAYDKNGQLYQTAIELQACCNSTSLVITITPHEDALDGAVAAFVCYDALNDVVQQEMVYFNFRRVFSHTSNLSSTAVRCSANVSYLDRNNNPEENIYAMCSIPRSDPPSTANPPSTAITSAERTEQVDMVTHSEEPPRPGPVSELKAETGFTSIILTWNAPEELTGVIIGYEVTYSVNGGSLMSVNSTDAASTFTISLLTPSTAIQDITVAAYTREGRGEVTGLAGVRTLAETQLPVVRNVRAEQLSTTAVRVSWDGIDVPEITGYIVYSQIVNIAETEEYRRVPSTEQSVDILGIKSIVPYQFTVAATAQFYEGRVTIGHRSLVDDQSVITISVLTKGDISSTIVVSGAVIFLLTFLFTISTVLLILLCMHHGKMDKEKAKSNEMKEKGDQA